MLFCDLSINNVPIFSGVLCLNLVLLDPEAYLPFTGALFFQDTQGSSDPDYTGLNGRYLLTYATSNSPSDLASAVSVPLQAVPNQSVSIALGGQNCLLNVYTKTATMTT